MKIGIVSINVGGPSTAEKMVGIAQHAEAAGIESVWTFEHVVVPVDYESKYPYDRSGKMPAAPETCFFDPLISLAHVAGATKTIRLGTGVNIFPQTNPMLFAKQTASLDALSGGRLTLGLGIGWLAEEYQAMGTPFERRGARFDDYLEAVKKVWSGDVVEHESDFLSWHGFKSYPTPVQKPHPPILIGGTTTKTLERVVNAADGWYAPSDSQEVLTDKIGQLKEMAAQVGRPFDSIDITTNWRIAVNPDALPEFEDLGITRAVVLLGATGESVPKKAIDLIASRADL
ncbi:MAG: LLM class F420-dependent oxidoreductase [Deltaproteobacteria bacterium]|nr:LLM class F420-dependent oxidoreductase [Deltaproteobacteria bacterium]MBW2547231.1 LLM class F420-dependent oxidoreductase [Deltaproteobacteria bacterium]MBW2717395.1 LLM class F420-dependent oxidoreductase [Deltaproteobacteria bacterium]RLB52009.1 MAG: LLM class F420-dependent oxidoreductase [Deltaproteobacteria bacterium]